MISRYGQFHSHFYQSHAASCKRAHTHSKEKVSGDYHMCVMSSAVLISRANQIAGLRLSHESELYYYLPYYSIHTAHIACIQVCNNKIMSLDPFPIGTSRGVEFGDEINKCAVMVVRPTSEGAA